MSISRIAPLLWAIASLDAQTIVYVNASAPTEGDGSSWSMPHKYLAAALADAAARVDNSGEAVQVWIATGTYLPDQSVTYPDGSVDGTASFMLHSSVAIFGGFDGTETSLAQRDPAANPVLLTGFPDYSNGTRHVVTSSGVDATAAIDGVTITNPRDSNQGCAAMLAGDAVVRNCIITGNRTRSGSSGAGIYCTGGSPLIEDCTFAGNICSAPGGMGAGIWCAAGSVTVRDCLFDDNKADAGGTAIWQQAGDILIEDCVFSNNRGTIDGTGGALNLKGGFTIRRSLFDHNTSYYSGGAIAATTAGLIEDCSFVGNRSTTANAGAITASAGPTIVNCLFIDNSGSFGGAILGSGTRINCTFIDNSASRGGAINGTGTNINCLFFGNNVTNSSDGICSGTGVFINCVFSGNTGAAVLRGSGGPVTVTNCSFAGNGGIDISMNGAAVTVRNTVFYKTPGALPPESKHVTGAAIVQNSFLQGLGPVFSGNGNLGGSLANNPRLADPDGPDNIPGTADDNLRLLAGSPCIDAGNSNAVPSGTTTDGDGNPRFADDPGMPDAGSLTPPVVDMGAYEFQETSCLADFNGDTFVDGIDYDLFNNFFESGDPAADLNRDGFVDGIDYDLFNNFFEAGC